MSTQRFAGKVMVVTGAAQGIGRAVALRAATEGGKVLFVDRAEFVCEVAAEASGAQTAGFVADLETYEGAASANGFCRAQVWRHRHTHQWRRWRDSHASIR
jgi:Dehydrogenases with different specificities (related to short-chain alcohol dehydrogenases)